MQTNISNWGNSLGLRIPKAIAEIMGISSGSKVEVKLHNGKLIISSISKNLETMAKEIDLDSMVAQITPENKHSISEDIPMGKEMW